MSLPPAVSKYFPAIPDPGGDPSSYLPTIQALKAAVELLTRQQAPKMYSSVLWQELVNAGLLAADGGTLQAQITPSCGRLTYVNATSLSFAPFNGDRIKINGTVYNIPAVGIAGLGNTGVYVNGVAGQNLVASTLYYIYAFNNGGTITASFSTTGHATSATAGNVGTEIKTGDDTCSLIGMIRTNASSQFVDAATSRYVASWFNRIRRNLTGATASVSTTALAYTELSVSARIDFVSWGDAVDMGWIGLSYNNTTNDANLVSLGLDSSAAALAATESANAPALTVFPHGGFGVLAPTEGYHYLTPVGFVNGGTGQFGINAYAAILT